MKSKKTNNGYIIRLEKGEEIIETLTKFCEQHKITGAYLQGIGGVSEAELGYFDVENTKYKTKTFKQDNKIFELLNLQGNITILEGKPFCHIHLILGKEDYSSFGGHLIKAIVNPTCEIFLTIAKDEQGKDLNISRAKDDITGFNLIDL